MRYITVQKDGRYRVDIRLMIGAAPFRATTTVIDLERARQFRDAKLQEHHDLKYGKSPVDTSDATTPIYTVQSWCEHCLKSIMPNQATARGENYAPQTLALYESLLGKHVYPVIGSVLLQDGDVTTMDTLMASIKTTPNQRNAKKYLSRIYELAESRGHRPKGSNPARGIKIAAAKHSRTPNGLSIEQVRVCTFEEEAAILQHVKNHPLHSHHLTLFLLGFKLGLRIGEALGLDWAAVDFESGTVKIRQQSQRQKGNGITIKDVKSKAGFRTIPMPKSLAEHLLQVSQSATSAHVICNNQGYRRDASHAASVIKKLVISAGVDAYDDMRNAEHFPRPSFHDFRRTFLTRLATGRIAPGITVPAVPPSTLVKISGHEEAKTLLSFYVSSDDDAVADAMSKMP